eukprot:1216675-Amphidinium_carterae.2
MFVDVFFQPSTLAITTFQPGLPGDVVTAQASAVGTDALYDDSEAKMSTSGADEVARATARVSHWYHREVGVLQDV